MTPRAVEPRVAQRPVARAQLGSREKPPPRSGSKRALGFQKRAPASIIKRRPRAYHRPGPPVGLRPGQERMGKAARPETSGRSRLTPLGGLSLSVGPLFIYSAGEPRRQRGRGPGRWARARWRARSRRTWRDAGRTPRGAGGLDLSTSLEAPRARATSPRHRLPAGGTARGGSGLEY